MTLRIPVDFDSLPKPKAIEELSYAQILAEQLDDVRDRFAADGIDYDVGNLKFDPLRIALEVTSDREARVRARINDGVRSNLLAFSTGSDLDHLAGFYGVERLAGEADARFWRRVALLNSGNSPAGPEPWYEFHAMSADVRIADVRVYRIDGGPKLGLAVLSSVAGGVPDGPMLAAVVAAVNDPAVIGLNDVLVVSAATSQTADITGEIWLLPNTPITIFEGLEASLRSAWLVEGGIGRDLARSWIIAKLHVAGVAKVTISAPIAEEIVARDIEAIAIGDVDLQYRGYIR